MLPVTRPRQTEMSESCRRARDDVEYLLFKDCDKRFFPLDRLRQFFSESKIREILLCRCYQCVRDLRLFPNHMLLNSILNEIRGPPNESDSLTKTRYGIFGLLVYVEHPHFIIGFLQGGCSDYTLDSWAHNHTVFSRENLERYTPNWRHDPQKFEAYVQRFEDQLPKFAVPHLESMIFIQYDPKVIFPFVGEKEIGKRTAPDGHLTSEGANGKVFEFKLYHEYGRFLGIKPEVELARKQIQTPKPLAFLEEGNIQHVQKFRDPHIVKLFKAYGHGGSINLIFPKAWTNLDHLLRDENFRYESKRNAKLELNDAWKQLLGISEALKKIQGFGRGADSRDNPNDQSCIHFDLKPDNILIEKHDGKWLITDFGQAALTQQRRGMTPRVGGHFGTDSYAPPEIEDMTMRCGRAYDIWSLGCIFLEVTAFLVLGYVGLKGAPGFGGLDEARRASPRWKTSRIADERFFYRASPNGDYVVKQEILDLMNSLQKRHARSPNSSEVSKKFLSTIIDLIGRMLKPNVQDRVYISRVVEILSSAISLASAVAPESDPFQVVVADGETALGGSQFNDLNLWHYSEHNKRWESAHLEALLSDAGFLRLHCRARGHEPFNINFKRNDAKVLPLYAFWDSVNVEDSKPWIEFANLTEDYVSRIPNAQLSFDGITGLEAARIVQSKLTFQDIKASFALTNVKLTRPASLEDTVNAVKGFFRKKKSATKTPSTGQSQRFMEFGSATAQIWAEEEEDEIMTRSKRRQSKSHGQTYTRPTRQFDQKLRPCRVAIYLHQERFICTIKMDVNWIAEESTTDDKVLTFKPHPPGRKQVFYASWISPTEEELDAGYPAGVPLNPQVLQYYEDLDSIEVETFELEFRSAQDREDFKWKYLEVKKDWNKERDKLENIFPTNRMLGAKLQLPDGVSGLPVSKKRARLKTLPPTDSARLSTPSTRNTNSRHDSTVESVIHNEQDPRLLTVPGNDTRVRRPIGGLG